MLFCRAYPPEYGRAVSAAHAECPNPSIPVPSASDDVGQPTDRELFETMLQNPDVDLWLDADFYSLARYLRKNKHLCLPDSWRDTVDKAMALLKRASCNTTR